MTSIFRDVFFWIAIILLILTDVFFIVTFLDWFDFGIVFGPYRLNHWLGWMGFGFILIHIPLFITLKRKYVSKIKWFFGIHVVGNLLAFLLISIHFASQISRPNQFYPDLGTGLALYFFMIVLVISGFLQRFNLINSLRKIWRFLHTSSAFSLFVIIIIHILHGINLI
jgi:hypothetical protein